MSRFLTRPVVNTEEERNEKADILELINFERFCRDNSLWDEMRKCYAKDSFVNISWYQGSGDGFVTASQKSPYYAPHTIHNSLTWINKDRAVTVMNATIENRRTVKGVECELSTDTQLLFSTEKIDGQWYIVRFESIYEQDRLIPVLPDATLSLDSKELAKFRQSYACMSYCMELSGIHANQELAGRDRPETVQKIYADLSDWLDGGERK